MSGKPATGAGSFGEQVIGFFRSLRAPASLPEDVTALNPYASAAVMRTVSDFYSRYFSDSNSRIYLVGINPGRFGAGATGIAFTDSDALRAWGVESSAPETRELSAGFISSVIQQYGGPERFYSHCFITSLCPLGFTRFGRNYNYYDDVRLRDAVLPWMHETFARQQAFGAARVAIVLGKGKNHDFLSKMNAALGFFDEIIPLEHPRFIMQYRRRQMEAYRERYLDALARAQSRLCESR